MRDEIFGLAQGATAVSSPGLRRRLSAWLMALSVVRWGGPAALSLRGKGRALSRATAPFRPGRVAVLSKTTRFEFEQERGRAEGERRRELRERLATKGSSYNGLLERHTVHSANVQHVVDTLHKEGIEVRLVKRRDYTEEIVQWADAIVSAGGDGTMLLSASKVFGQIKPVIGVNTDPERSQGHLCLPVRYTHCFSEALQKLRQGEFSWQWRQRIRICLEGAGINPTPVDLHEQQLSLEQHLTAHRDVAQPASCDVVNSDPQLLSVRALNEVFVGESLSSRLPYHSHKQSLKFSLHRASYCEISIDDGPWEKHKNSGLNMCTGTGSRAWSYNINKLAYQEVEDLLSIAKEKSRVDLPINQELVEQVTDHYNQSLIFCPEDPKIFFSIREPIVNRVFTSSQHRGFTNKMSVRSRCWDACMVVDGGTSFEFNDGAIATLTVNEEDALCTVVLEE
ncbi:NAD kinase 2, mitochondrial isoform X3 [Chiloscyllium plagiosum]|uniref:NAD kinase 2, mitochondrial isoform X3 n=1 Tax=Chiloscyllium plagiosum TaxID=36176 RepID=UPI001CB7B885|nr:NAD kinase 2, mitochondrial isoform X3 [Chiloscyllium plagiosum]